MQCIKKMSRCRGYVFTLNNWTEEEVEKLRQQAGYKYLIFGREVGENGTPHLQGYVYWKAAKTFSACKKALGSRYHIEAQKGSCEQAIDYCKKENNYEEIGHPPLTQKEKGDKNKKRYERAWDLAKQGKIEEIDADIRVRHFGTLKRIRSEYQQVPESVSVLEHEWYWGDSGTGKTRKARESNPGAYLKNPNKWWCGYVDQEVVVIDEWSPSHECLASHLKQWADHHPFCAETKGSSMCIRPRKIIVTSNYSMEQCFSREEDLEPLRRRFKITHFNK